MCVCLFRVSVLNGKLVILKETRKCRFTSSALIHADTQTLATTILYGYDQELNPGAVTEIRDYFQLDRVSLKDCYQRWSKIDANFAKKSVNFQGIRMLRQDPWENLISFICSSNNNISRISQMVGWGEKRGREPHCLCTNPLIYTKLGKQNVCSIWQESSGIG